MPIRIEKLNGDDIKEIAFLCDDDWELPSQVGKLKSWILQNFTAMNQGEYVADIGFSVRGDASGGGSAIDSKVLKIMGEIGMSLWLSEYP
jgi:hypothetical protein